MIKNIKFTPRFINILQIFITIFILFIMASLFFSPFIAGEIRQELAKPYNYTNEVRVDFDNGHSRNVKLPAVIHTRQPFKVTIPFSNFGMIDGKTLSFVSKDTLIRCEVDNTIIYRNIGARAHNNYFDGNTIYFIDLPDVVKNKFITLHYEYSKGYLTSFELKEVKIGTRANILVDYFLRHDIFGTFLILLLVVLSIVIFSIHFILKDKSQNLKYFIQVALLCLCLALYIFSCLPIMYFLASRHRTILHFLRYTMPMLIPLPFLNAVFIRLNPASKKPLKIGIFLSFINILLQHVLTLTSVTTLTETSLLTVFVLLLSFVIFFWLFFTNTDKKQLKDKKTMLFTLSPLILATILEIFVCKLRSTPPMTFTFLPLIFIYVLFQSTEYFAYLTSSWRKQKEATLYQSLAMCDSLTGLGSRLAYKDALEEYQKSQFGFFCILLDIDCLKLVNDNLGHKDGDRIIIKLSTLLKKAFTPERSAIYRIGGDEFVVFYKTINETELSTQLESIALEYAKKDEDETNNIPYGVSYGFSYFTPGKNLEKVLHEADARMYMMKSSKKVRSRSNYSEASRSE